MTNTNRWWHSWIFNPYGNFNLKRQGRIDGKLSIPPWTSEEQPDFLRGLYHVTQTTLEALGEAWHKLDRHLKGAWVAATLRQQQAGKELAEATEREEQAQQRHEEVHGRRLAVPDSRGRTFAYWLVVAAVLVCEFPLNAIVFQQLGVSTYETWLMTGAIATALVACAHFLGAQLHQPVRGRPLVVINRVLLASLPFIAIIFIAMLRRDHMRQQALSNLDPWQLLGTNLIINLLIFWAVVYYSYKLHDPVVEAVLKALRERRFKAQQLHLAEKATASARIDRQKGHQQMQQDATSWLPEVRRRAAVYRCAHIRVRPDRNQHGSSVPIWSNLEPDLAIPEDLQQLEWNIDPASDAAGETVPTQRFRASAARQKTMRNNLILSMILVAAAASSGCRLTANNEPASGTFLVCLFDRSITADGSETKNRYLADFGKLAADLQPGDTVVADAITENPTATMRFPVHIVLSSYDPAQSNPLMHRRESQAAKRTLLEQVAQLVRETPATKKTAIMDALYVTRKALRSDAGKKAAHRVLVVFSDMREDSERANFEKEHLRAGEIKALLDLEEKNNRLPDLKGVDVWVAGATPDRTMGEARIRSIETFWEAYFSRCGATLPPDRYGPALLNFALAKN